MTDVLKTVEGEIALFRGVIKHRPIGMSKHWCMLGLASELSQTFPASPPTTEQIWSSLVALYDFRTLDETEDSYVTSELEEGPISLSPAALDCRRCELVS
ncbi:hypothetical protein BT69DRAFT_1101489 [Atractiella rhizophila]|nr:hypothetical protein BT69DRAFT_1101489 [Atractiella rhizophila]